MPKDWKGDVNAVFKTLGASNHTDNERPDEDYYATDPIAIDKLLEDGGVVFTRPIWEPACGAGHLSKRLEEYDYEVVSTDLIDRGYGKSGVDFLKCNDKVDMDIVTNPPYKYAQQFIEHALDITTNGNKILMFLQVRFLEGKGRRELFHKTPPKTIYVSSARILCARNGDFASHKKGDGGAIAYAWYKWVKGDYGETTIKWIN